VSQLRDIQGALQRFLLTGSEDIHTHVVGTERVPVATRLGIYGDAYRSRLIEALETSFPVLAALLGDGDFHELASRYVSSYESTFFSIRYYGDRLAEFLATDDEYANAPLLAELARWEWAMADAFDAADAEPVDASVFAEVAPDAWAELHFVWSPSVQVLELEWNVPAIWKAVTEGSGAVAETADTGEGTSAATVEPPEPELAPASWLIWRQALQIYFRPLSAEEAAAIAASRAGQSFGELCVALCEHLEESDASRHAAGFLRGWVESGLITQLRL
jgi:hypothetical protein